MQENNSPENTEARGAEAAAHCAVEGRARGKVMVREPERAEYVLRRECDAPGRKGSGDGAERWLCENIWFLRRALRQIALRFRRERLRRSGRRWLLLALTLTEAHVGCCGGRMTAEECAAFLRGFQSVLPLTEAELREGVPDEGRTICVISVLLTKKADADEAVRRQEEFFLANRDCGDNLLFGLLRDLPGCEEESRVGDRALLFASSLSRPRAVHAAVDGDDRAYLLERAGEIWKFFPTSARQRNTICPRTIIRRRPA